MKLLAGGGVREATLTNGANIKEKMAGVFAEHETWVRGSTDAWDDERFGKPRVVKSEESSTLLRNMRDFVARKSKCFLGVSFIVD